jgi:hypothetical protein
MISVNTFLVVMCWIGGIVVVVWVLIMIFNRGKKEIRKLTINGVDLLKMPPGRFTASFLDALCI